MKSDLGKQPKNDSTRDGNNNSSNNIMSTTTSSAAQTASAAAAKKVASVETEKIVSSEKLVAVVDSATDSATDSAVDSAVTQAIKVDPAQLVRNDLLLVEQKNKSIEQRKKIIDAETKGIEQDTKAIAQMLKRIESNFKKCKFAEKRTRTSTNNNLEKPVAISEAMAAFLGVDAGEKLSRNEVRRRIIAYIKTNGLQRPENKTFIVLDDKLKTIFNVPEGEDVKLTFFSMQKYNTHNFV